MKTITDAVRIIFKEDEVAREAARRGVLNSSAYAREILNKVSDLTLKEVEETSINVAINRVTKENNDASIKPTLIFDKVSVETGLVDVTFEKTEQLKKFLSDVLPSVRNKYPHDLFIETSSQHQVTMIMSHAMWADLQSLVPAPAIGAYNNQVAISIAFDKRYLVIPNFIYAVLAIFTIENINLTEVFSTMTEIVIVIDVDYLDVALSGVKKFMK
jgi:hypothetical protein